MSTFQGAVSSAYPLIVFCHLRWDFVWQRPQQFHSRFAKRHRVLFVEGPLVEPGDFEPYYTLRSVKEHSGVTLMQMHFSDAAWGKGGIYVDAMRRALLDKALATDLKGRFDSPVAWFYDPMAVESHLGQHGAIATVYDCMDELSQFRFAPPELIARERRLLLNADVVFAGGRKMAHSKRRFNTNVHFYGCGVDVAHFGKARSASTLVPDDIKHLEGKVLGFFGVVDERLDYDLIAQLADANSDWDVVMIGPTAKVDPKDFPQRPNLHWLGGRDYSQLPTYTKRFDIALMPFALNEATEYINPTKALEYMATATPIISTPVPDVVSNFSSVCKISKSSEEFIKFACEQAAQVDQVAVERGVKMAAENTWDAIVAKMEGHIADVFECRADVHSKIRIPSTFPAATAA
ncbi:putative teichuronic acid biosynthesis glycosyltransferase TuaH [Abditibacteriota bacterium]|nr:putative teichuronic acid biosynthesis glycosyltransferase TuaH [Abditibacteriota bacterium]